MSTIRAITADSLGSTPFKNDYGLRYAYLAGSMYKGIASREMVVAMGRAGMMGYLGTGSGPRARSCNPGGIDAWRASV